MIRRPTADRGAISLEFALVAPVLFAVLFLIYAYGRVAWANGHLEAGARDAARVATQAPSQALALDAANRVLDQNTADVPGCAASSSAVLTGTWEQGSTITVEASCTYSLADIGLPGLPGSLSPHSSFASVIDEHKTLFDDPETAP